MLVLIACIKVIEFVILQRNYSDYFATTTLQRSLCIFDAHGGDTRVSCVLYLLCIPVATRGY
jgi:hypothetical protein